MGVLTSKKVKITSWTEYILTHYRGVFCLFFLLPLSALFEAYLWLRNAINFWMRRSAKKTQHATRVNEISTQVKAWATDGKKAKMCTARPGWQTMSLRVGKYKKTNTKIYLGDLCNVLDVNVDAGLVKVEPLVTMGQLTHALLPLGYTIPVLPELDDLTVGGLVSGVGIETSSHKYGLFQYICVHFELVLADGTVINCSKDEHPEIFYMVPWSHGTLGFLTAATIKMIPAKEYVKVEYLPFRNQQDAIECFERESRKGTDDDDETCAFGVEALAYSRDHWVVMIANMCDEPKGVERTKINKIGYYFKPWFYTHVEKYLATGAAEEYIPLRHYYHRHTRSLFWEVSDIVPFGNQAWFRYLLGYTMPPKPALLKLSQTEMTRQLYELHHVVQDLLVPVKNLGESIDLFHKEFEVYPLWLCPMRIKSDGRKEGYHGLIKPLDDGDEMFVDVGAYGNPLSPTFVAADSCRKCEDFVRQVKGYQMMYADTYMTREEFREMFDHSQYDKLRASLPNCLDAFPEIYDKVCKKNRI